MSHRLACRSLPAAPSAHHPLVTLLATILTVLLIALLTVGCGGEESSTAGGGEGARSQGRPGGGGGAGAGRGGPARPGGGAPSAAVPVEVHTVQRQDLAAYLQTTGVLEAEVAVDLVSRTSGPITSIAVEESDAVRKGQLLATIDERELRARFEIARVARDEAQRAQQRAQRLFDGGLISEEDVELARNRAESATAELDGAKLALDYSRVVAPFSGVVVTRYIKPAQTVSPGEALFHVVDLDPLLCSVQVPEGRLPDLEVGQGAYLTVEAWGASDRFSARVLRISPVVDAGTGTVRVTLAVERRGKLAPGMFAAVFLELESRPDALVVPREALTLESLGDTLYVVNGASAQRRNVTVGVRQGDLLEIVSGVDANDEVVVVGQDGLADGTPVEVLVRDGASVAASGPTSGARPSSRRGGSTRGGNGSGEPGASEAGGPSGSAGGAPGFDPAQRIEAHRQRFAAEGLSPDEIRTRLERLTRQRLEERGATEEDIEQRLEALRQQLQSPARQLGNRPASNGASRP